MRRGYTLVELMVVVAVLGILAALAGGTGRAQRLEGLEMEQRERAALLLDYLATCASTGAAQDPATLARLVGALPDERQTALQDGDAVTLRVTWRGPGNRPEARALTVFVRP